MKKSTRALLIITASVCLATSALADVLAIDENGNGIGTIGRGFLAPDPGPGGLPSVLTYILPFTGVQGDVLMSSVEPGFGNVVFDIIRFNGNGTVVFYSDNLPVADSLADTTGPPGALYANQIIIAEVGPEGNNVGIYTPLAGQPGFDPNAVHTYNFVSDGTVPEPSAVVLLGTVFVLLGIMFRRREIGRPILGGRINRA
jgi:PEP-CTERM motif